MTYIRLPFAVSGQRTEIPEESVAGAVSFNTGWGPQYQEDPTTSGTARRINRELHNGLMFRLSTEIQQQQQFGVPEWISAADNDGVDFPYSNGALVRYNPTTGGTTGDDTLVYRSLINNNTSLPTVSSDWLDTSTYTTGSDFVENTTEINTQSNSGLAGGGDLSANRDLSVDVDNLTAAVPAGTNEILFSIGSESPRKVNINTFISTFVTGAYISSLSGVDADTLDGNLPAATSISDSLLLRDGDGNGRVSSMIVDDTSAVTSAFVLTSPSGSSTMARRSILDFKTDAGVQNLNGSNFTGTLTLTGTLTAFNVTATSDEKLKNEIKRLDPDESLESVLKWRKAITTYNDMAVNDFGAPKDPQVSFYAQDIMDTHPAMVSQVHEKDGFKYNGVAYDRSPVVIASAIEALVDKIEQIESKLNDIETFVMRGGT